MSEWITMKPAPIKVRKYDEWLDPKFNDAWEVEFTDGTRRQWLAGDFAEHGLTPPEPPPPPVTVTIELTEQQATAVVREVQNWTSFGHPYDAAVNALAAAIRAQREATDGD